MEESADRYWFDMMPSSSAASKIFWAQGLDCFEPLAALPPSSAEVRFGISAVSRFSQNPLSSWLVWTADLCFSALRHLNQKVMLDSCRNWTRNSFDLFHKVSKFVVVTHVNSHALKWEHGSSVIPAPSIMFGKWNWIIYKVVETQQVLASDVVDLMK